MDRQSVSRGQETSVRISSHTGENQEPIDALVCATVVSKETEDVRSFDTSAFRLRRALHSIDSNRPSLTLPTARRSVEKILTQSCADRIDAKKVRGQALATETSKKPNETTERLMTGRKRPAAAAGEKAKARLSLEDQYGGQDSENLAWMDMMLALLEKRYGSNSSLPVCVTDLEAANLFQLPQSKKDKTEGTPAKSKSTVERCMKANDNRLSKVSATDLLEIPARVHLEQDMGRKVKRQQLLMRVAQQIQASSVSSYTSCGCKTGCLKMYCMCFSSRGYCHAGCTCDDCKNGRKNQTERVEAIQHYLSNDPRAFSFASLTQDSSTSGFLHLLPQKSSAVVLRGCRCKKSKCLKKYCECYQNGIACTSHCRCMECSNRSESKVAHQHFHKRSTKSEPCVSQVKPFHPVHIFVTKQPRKNHVGKTLRLNL